MDNSENVTGYDPFLLIFEASGSGYPYSLNHLSSSLGGNEYPTRLTADRQGNFYVGGKFTSALYVADDTLYNQAAQYDGFIAKFGTDSCYCPPPVAAFTFDSLPDVGAFSFAYSGTANPDSVVWDFGDGQSGYGTNPTHLFAISGTYTVCATAYNHCGFDSVCTTLTVTGPDAVRLIGGFEKIHLYPNPAHETLNIAHAQAGTRVAVVNAVGTCLYRSELQSGTNQIGIGALPPGLYLLQFTRSDGMVGYARFVKQ